jgi:arylsulfatase A-like enzyme
MQLLSVVMSAVTQSPQPNIVFILADDLGYNELNFMNSTRGIQTPALDVLAQSGVVMKNYYVQPICSPTRSALMTGRYTTRLGTQSNVIFWDNPWGIALNETFIPQNLKDAGYSTAMFGKWHLGMHKQDYTPMKRGFDQHMGYYQGCESAFTHVAACCTAGSPDSDENYVCAPGKWGKEDYRGYDWFKTDEKQGISVPDFSANHTNSAVLIRDRAVDFLKSRKGQTNPFFLYLPFQNIHGPYTGMKKYRDLYNTSTQLTEGEKTMFGYLTEMDYMVADIVAAMKTNSLYDDSVIIFSSDNGAPGASADVDHAQGPHNPGWIARNYPFRGQKNTNLGR